MSTDSTVSPDSTAVVSLSRPEYQQLLDRGRAGEVAALPDGQLAAGWRERFPGWRARYWTYTDPAGDGVLHLAPVNVIRQRRASAD